MTVRLHTVLAAVLGATLLTAACAEAMEPEPVPGVAAPAAVASAAPDVVVPSDAPGPASGGLVHVIPPPPPAPRAQPAVDATRQAAGDQRASRSTKRTSPDAGSAGRGTSPVVPAAPPAAGDSASSIEAAVNAQRRSHGLPALAPSGCASRFAQQWAHHLAGTGAFAHQPLGPVMGACGSLRAAENIASTDGSASQTVALWMASAGHRANILQSQFTHSGVAAVRAADGHWICVQVFVTL